MNLLTKFVAIMLAAASIASCHNGQDKGQATTINRLVESVDAEPPAPPKEQQQTPIPVGNGTPSPADSTPPPSASALIVQQDWDKQIIKTATLRLEVKNFNQYHQTVQQAVKQYGGYVASEEQETGKERLATSVQIKVPVAQFDAMLNQLPGDNTTVLERTISTEDVSTEVVDTRARLEAKKQMRLKYLDFLKQSKNIQELLEVQGEVNRIQEEIESAAGRMQYLTHSAAMSTIKLSFYQPLAGFTPVDTNPSFVTRLVNGLSAGAAWLVDLVVLLAHVWPLLIMVIAFLLLRKRKIFSRHAA